MKYDIIIVLCPEKKDPDGKFPDFKDGMYLGGQVRMDAAKKIYENNENAEFIVVGGYNSKSKRSEWEKVDASQKVDDMKSFLKKDCLGIKIIPIKSLPCTKHNLVAIFNTWKNSEEKLKRLKDKKIGLLTNFYHLPRALRFWGELTNTEEFMGIPMPISISAESIIELPVNNMHIRFIEYLLRLEDERRGLKDIENESYAGSCLGKKFDDFKDIIEKYKDILLTESERIKPNV